MNSTEVTSKAPLRCLFLDYGYGPPAAPSRYTHLAGALTGDIIIPARAPVSENVLAVGDFGLSLFKARGLSLPLRGLLEVLGYVRAARRLVREGKSYDLIVANGLFKTALAGILLKVIWHRPLLIDVTIVPHKIVMYRAPGRPVARRIRGLLFRVATAAVLSVADHLKIIFPGHAAAIWSLLAKKPQTAFPDFAPISEISATRCEDPILLIGTPLYLKGADLAIKAFLNLRGEFPNERLTLVGSALGFRYLRTLMAPSDPIELIDYLPHSEALKSIEKAKIILIPSRTDAMPRVATEAMAAGKPIIAAAVDGMPAYLTHNETALLFPPGDVESLTLALRALLGSPELRQRLGSAARTKALNSFNESEYVRRFAAMAAMASRKVRG